MRLQRRRHSAAAQSLIENERAKTTKTEKTAVEKIAINNTRERGKATPLLTHSWESSRKGKENKEGEES